MIENIKFLIKQYEDQLKYANEHAEYFTFGEIENYMNIIEELKFILELEGINYEES